MSTDNPTIAKLFTDTVLRVAGDNGLAKLRAIAGGTKITVPIYPAETSVITRALGIEVARQVCLEMRALDGNGRPIGCPPFYLSMGLDVSNAVRHRRIVELHGAGMSGANIALDVGLSERTVRKVISKLRSAAATKLDHSAQVGGSVDARRREVSP